MKDLIKEYKWFFIILTMLCIAFCFVMPPYGNAVTFYSFTLYYLNYDFGFIARGLLGAIYKLIFGIVTYKSIYFSTFVISIYLLMLIAFLFDRLIKKYKDNKIIYFLVPLLVISPASFLYMFQNAEFGRFDMFLLINALISIIIIYRRKFLYLIPVIGVISILIHENFIFFYLPLISMLLLFNYFDKKEKNNLKILFINIIVCFIAFLVVWTIGKETGFSDAVSYGKYLQEQSDFVSNQTIPYYEFFQTKKEMFDLVKERCFLNQNILDFVYGFITLCAYFLLMWFLVLKHKYNETKYKKLFVLLIMSCFSAFCLFFIAVDYGRWYVNMTNNLIILTVFVMMDNSKLLMNKLKNINYKYYIIMVVMFIFYLLMFNTEIFHFMKFDKINRIFELIIK